MQFARSVVAHAHAKKTPVLKGCINKCCLYYDHETKVKGSLSLDFDARNRWYGTLRKKMFATKHSLNSLSIKF